MVSRRIELASGLVKFRSKEEVRSYLEEMLQYYKTVSEEYGQQMGTLLRGVQAPPPEVKVKQAKDEARPSSKGWVRLGSLPVNVSDPSKATAEVMLKVVEEYKTRIEKTTEALKSLVELDSVVGGDGQSLTLFVSKGIPEALILGSTEAKREVFSFVSAFRAV